MNKQHGRRASLCLRLWNLEVAKVNRDMEMAPRGWLARARDYAHLLRKQCSLGIARQSTTEHRIAQDKHKRNTRGAH